jgi:hypothetical protein
MVARGWRHVELQTVFGSSVRRWLDRSRTRTCPCNASTLERSVGTEALKRRELCTTVLLTINEYTLKLFLSMNTFCRL